MHSFIDSIFPNLSQNGENVFLYCHVVNAFIYLFHFSNLQKMEKLFACISMCRHIDNVWQCLVIGDKINIDRGFSKVLLLFYG